MNVGLVGLGTVGRALASWLADSGFQVKAVSSRNRTSAEKFATQLGAKSLPPEQVAAASHLLFITTSDDAISEVCGNIARHGFGNCQAVFHLSGALSSLALAPAEKAGLGAASIHPLGSFTDFQQARKLLPQCWFTIEGNERGLFWAERVLTRLGAKFRQLSNEQKPLYHLAAVYASNYLVSLLAVAAEIWEDLGLEPDEGLWQLAEGTLANIRNDGIFHSLTGPVKRGDLETVALHKEALAKRPRALELYCQLGLVALDLSEDLTEEQKQKMALLLRKETFQ